VYALRDDTVETVTGMALEAGTGMPVAGARIEAWTAPGRRPVGFAQTDGRGRFSLTLPASEYTLRATHRVRSGKSPVPIDLTRGEQSDVRLQLTPASRLSFRVREAGAGLIPSKLTFVGLVDTPDPDFGHRSQMPGARNVYFSRTGEGELELPPGRYQVTVSRGIEYSIQQIELKLEPGDQKALEATLVHEVDTGGYLAADLHQHTLHSYDAWVQLEDVVTANLAEGVEVVAATDVDHVTDFLPLLQGLELESRIKILAGQEIRIPEVGSFIVCPVEPDPSLPGNGALQAGSLEPGALLEALRGQGPARIVQVNHPREGQEGYFDLLQLDPHTAVPGDPRFSFGFNTLEVFNGKRMKHGSQVLRDWFLLLNKGYVFTATGGSDSRSIVTQERGYPRTYLGIYSDSPGRVSDQEVVSVVRDRHDAVVTNGPFLRVTANGFGRIGSLVPITPATSGEGGEVRLEVEVQAPGWIRIDEIEIIANGEVVRRLPASSPDGVVKFHETLTLRPTRDTWYVVVARGSKGLEPVVPRYKGTTVTPFGFTNPIWIDVDGDRAFRPLFPRDTRELGYIELPLEQAE